MALHATANPTPSAAGYDRDPVGVLADSTRNGGFGDRQVIEADFVSIIQAYNEVTERLKRSHDALAGEVCRLREQIHEKNKELARRERLAALGQMAAGVAHASRNPLGGIGLYASLLERDLVDRPKERAIVRKLSVGVTNLDGLVHDILAFAGDAEPHLQRVLIGRMIESAVDQTAPKAAALGISLQTDGWPTGDIAFCDSTQIERALINLLLNAFDAAGSGGHVWIRRGAPRAGRLFQMIVEDSGPGIAPELLQRVFNPFFTTKDTGTGLGLAIVHRIAEANGGSIGVANRSGGGARFMLSIPRFSTRHADSVERYSAGDGGVGASAIAMSDG